MAVAMMAKGDVYTVGKPGEWACGHSHSTAVSAAKCAAKQYRGGRYGFIYVTPLNGKQRELTPAEYDKAMGY